MERAFYKSWIFGKCRQKGCSLVHTYAVQLLGDRPDKQWVTDLPAKIPYHHFPSSSTTTRSSLRLYFPALHHSRGCVITFLTSYSMPELFLFSHTTPQPVKELCVYVCVTLQVCEEREEGYLPVSFLNFLVERNTNEKQRQSTHRSIACWFTMWLSGEECGGMGLKDL